MDNFIDLNYFIDEKEKYSVDNTYMLNINKELFTSNTFFNLFISLIKFKMLSNSNKLYIIYDYFLSNKNVLYFKKLIKRMNIKNVSFLSASDLLKQISFNDFFNYAKQLKLNSIKDYSFVNKTNICLRMIEKRLLCSNYLVLSNVPYLENESIIIFDRNIEFSVDVENFLNILENPSLLFGLLMSISDKNMKEVTINLFNKKYYILKNSINENPFYFKKILSKFILNLLYENKIVGEEALLKFEKRAQKIFDDCETIHIAVRNQDTLYNVLFSSGKFNSKSELRRLFNQNAIRTFENTVLFANEIINSNVKLKVGKKLFFSLEYEYEK